VPRCGDNRYACAGAFYNRLVVGRIVTNKEAAGLNTTRKIMVVDDEKLLCRMLGRLLTKNGYGFIAANSVEEAKEHLEREEIDLVLCDVNMPGVSGIELASHIKSHYMDTAILMLTAIDDPGTAEDAIDAGVYGYMVKPVKPSEVIINVRNALRMRDLEIANRRYLQNLENMVQCRSGQLRKAMEGIIRAMSLTVESRDPYTSGHQHRVSGLAGAIAVRMGLPGDQVQGTRLAAMIHDLGKISVPAEILSKPSRLSNIEFSLIKVHPEVGYNILSAVEFPWPIATIVKQHHERIDGSGYPLGLSKNEILVEARIISVADVVEAMVSHRPYRPALGIEKAIEEISNGSGRLYDPEVTKACLSLIGKGDFSFSALEELQP